MADATGVPRWPATLVEAGFNIVFALVALMMVRRGRLRGQLFHVYLIAYGLFRFGHEFLRDTPRIGGVVSVYQLISLAMVAFGAWRYVARRKGLILVGGSAEPSLDCRT